MKLSEIVPSILNNLVESRVWRKSTPDVLPRDANDRIKNFIIWSSAGGADAEYVDQTFGSHSNARLQVSVFSPSSIQAETLIKNVRDRLLSSGYTVGVYGSPIDTYDGARKLHSQMQQYSIWYRE